MAGVLDERVDVVERPALGREAERRVITPRPPRQNSVGCSGRNTRGQRRPRHVVVHEHPRPAMDRRRAVPLQRRLVHRARIALVRVERPVRVARRQLPHLTVPDDLGEDARGRDAETVPIGLDPHLDRSRRSGTRSSTCRRSPRRRASRPAPSIARRQAERCASAMPSSSHSSWLTAPADQPSHQSAIRSNNRSRSRSVSIFESRTPSTRFSRGRIAAPTIERPGPGAPTRPRRSRRPSRSPVPTSPVRSCGSAPGPVPSPETLLGHGAIGDSMATCADGTTHRRFGSRSDRDHVAQGRSRDPPRRSLLPHGGGLRSTRSRRFLGARRPKV